MPRFVLLEHDHPHRHWDLMLEAEGVLATWRLPAPLAVGQEISAERTFDHRLAYLDYEGPISGGRGQVVRRERGTFSWLTRAPGRIVAHVHGEKLEGILELAETDGARWQGSFQMPSGLEG